MATEMNTERKPERVFIVGVGGSGMSAIAQWLNARGCWVGGSDREHDRGLRPEFYQVMESQGIILFPQNGSGIDSTIDRVVISTAIEAQIPDLKAARDLNIPIVHRSEELARLVSRYQSIAVAGTSGKSTVTGMIGWILRETHFSPTIVNGAPIRNMDDSRTGVGFYPGHGSWCVFEADESDGTLLRFHPDLAIIHNISKDHMPLAELRTLFATFIPQIGRRLVFHAACPETTLLAMSHPDRISYGFRPGVTVMGHERMEWSWGSRFRVTIDRSLSPGDTELELTINIPGSHNAENALAAIAAALVIGVPPAAIPPAVASFPGIRRRFELVGTTRGIAVIDDYAHNPDKIRAALHTAHAMAQRIIAVFQPHGFRPMMLLFDEIVDAFSQETIPTDMILLTPIYYAGGTVSQDISSETIASAIRHRERCCLVKNRNDIPAWIRSIGQPGDLVLVMGARDPSLSDLCRQIHTAISQG